MPDGAQEQWWWDNQDQVDAQITEWSSDRNRDEAVAELHAVGVPAVPVCTAADRAAQPRYRERRIALRSPDGEWAKGYPLTLRGFTPTAPGPAPVLTEDVSDPESERYSDLLAKILPSGNEHAWAQPAIARSAD